MMKKILVPYDDSGFSQKAFEKGLEIAEKFQSQLIVLTVIQSKTSNSTGTSLERAQEIQDEDNRTEVKKRKKNKKKQLKWRFLK